MMRVQKYLSQAGICSRRKAEHYLKNGKISINGQIVIRPGTLIDPDKDVVCLNNEKITNNNLNKIYIALNKPKGYVTSLKHTGHKLVIDLIDIQDRIYPIGRLDKESTGLILLTNDGDLHNKLLHPSYDHEKEYEVIVHKTITDKDLDQMKNGIDISGYITRPAKIKRLSKKKFRIILQEGKNRQIRRMIDTLGNKIINLKRIRIANIKLGNLAQGAWRYLNKNEIQFIKKNRKKSGDYYECKSKLTKKCTSIF